MGIREADAAAGRRCVPIRPSPPRAGHAHHRHRSRCGRHRHRRLTQLLQHCTSKCITTRCAPSYDYTLGAFLCCYFLRPTLGLARSRAALCRTTALDRQQAIALANEFSLLPLPAAVAGGAAGQWRGNQDSKVESESQAVLASGCRWSDMMVRLQFPRIAASCSV